MPENDSLLPVFVYPLEQVFIKPPCNPDAAPQANCGFHDGSQSVQITVNNKAMLPDAGEAGTSHGLVALLGPNFPGYAVGITSDQSGSPDFQYAVELFDIDDPIFIFHLVNVFSISYAVDGISSEAGSLLVRVSVVPLPASIWLFGAGVAGLGLFGRRFLHS